MEDIVFTRKDFNIFYKWLDINIDSATWQNTHLAEFERFWFVFFVDGLSLRQLTERFDFATGQSTIGSLDRWLELDI